MSDCDNANCKCDAAWSLQQWMESCSAGRDPTCPLCKRSISCPVHDVHRLDFQSARSDSTEPQVSPSRNLQTAVEDPKHVNSSSASGKLSKLAAAIKIINEKCKELESQVAAAEAATVVSRSEQARLRQDLTSIQEKLICLSLELEKMQEEIGAMEKVLAVHEQAPWDSIFGLFGFCVKIGRIGIF